MKISQSKPVTPKCGQNVIFVLQLRGEAAATITKDICHLIELHCEPYHKIYDHPWLIFYVNKVWLTLYVNTLDLLFTMDDPIADVIPWLLSR